MSMGLPVTIAEPHSSVSRFALAALLSWWILHLGALFYSGADVSNTLQATEDGYWLNQLQISLLGVIGICAIVPALKAITRSGCTWPYWFLVYLSWSALTLVWSSSPGLGIRRLGALLLISVGAIGIGGGYYRGTPNAPAVLLKHLRLAGVIAVFFCAPLLAREMSIQNLLDPSWVPSFRAFGAEISFAASYALIVSLPIRRIRMWSSHFSVAYWLSTAALFILLILLKSRALIAFTLLIFTIVYLKTRNKTQLFFGITFLAISITLVAGFIADTAVIDLPTKLFDFVARGDDFRTLSLINGRVPLWQYVWNDAIQHPWIGVGFGSYWTATHLSAVWHDMQWQAPFAHNGYLDEMVQTGVIGLCLFLAFCVAAARDLRRHMRGPLRLPIILVLSWLALFLLINLIDSILQFYFKVPFFFTLAALSSCSAAIGVQGNNEPELSFRRSNRLARSYFKVGTTNLKAGEGPWL